MFLSSPDSSGHKLSLLILDESGDGAVVAPFGFGAEKTARNLAVVAMFRNAGAAVSPGWQAV